MKNSAVLINEPNLRGRAAFFGLVVKKRETERERTTGSKKYYCGTPFRLGSMCTVNSQNEKTHEEDGWVKIIGLIGFRLD